MKEGREGKEGGGRERRPKEGNHEGRRKEGIGIE